MEESDHKSLNATGDVDPKTKKAKMLPVSFFEDFPDESLSKKPAEQKEKA